MTESPQDRCRRYRRRILEISRQVSAAHIAPAFSCLEIVDALYHNVMRPDDIFIMSKGHGCLAQYVILEDMQWEPERECKTCLTLASRSGGYDAVCPDCVAGYTGPRLLDSYCNNEGGLGAHPDYNPGLGIHASTGSLGHGLGIAMGQAYAEKLKKSGVRVYCLLSDGECQEGSTWEAAMVAANLGLDNLTAIIDFNNWGGMQKISKSFPALVPISAKFKAFGWGTNEIDGHSDDLRNLALSMRVEDRSGRPFALTCRTVKGKGVSFIEAGQPLWHYRSPNAEEYEQAMRELG